MKLINGLYKSWTHLPAASNIFTTDRPDFPDLSLELGSNITHSANILFSFWVYAPVVTLMPHMFYIFTI